MAISKNANSTAIDKSGVPAELSIYQRAIEIKKLLALQPTDVITFKYGDYVPGATAFNQYLEANVAPGTAKSFTRDKAIHLIKQLSMTLNSGGLASLPMICLNEDCSRANDCPIRLIGDTPPVGQNCPVERTEALNHVRSLSHDFGEERTYADQLMIQGVAGIQMLKSRVMADMAVNSNVITEVKSLDSRGNTVIDKVENPNFKVLNNLLKQEQILLKGLHLTQAQRVKLNGGSGPKTSDVLVSSLKTKLQELIRNNKASGLDIKDAEIKDLVDLSKSNKGDVLNDPNNYDERTKVNAEIYDGFNLPPKNDIAGPDEDTDTAITRGISEGLRRIPFTNKDFRSPKQTGAGGLSKQYTSKSPFERGAKQTQNSNLGPDADIMEEVF